MCLSRKWSEIEAIFDAIFDPQGICRVYWQLFAKIVFPPLLAAILNFCVKHKNPLISETERDRAIDKIFDPQSSCRVYWPLFPKIVFLPLLAAILNFCVKHKTHLSWKRSEIERFRQNFLPIGYRQIFQKNRFPASCVKRKNLFMSKTELDRAISTKFLTRRISTESIGDISQNSFSRNFGRPSWIFALLEFLR